MNEIDKLKKLVDDQKHQMAIYEERINILKNALLKDDEDIIFLKDANGKSAGYSIKKKYMNSEWFTWNQGEYITSEMNYATLSKYIDKNTLNVPILFDYASFGSSFLEEFDITPDKATDFTPLTPSSVYKIINHPEIYGDIYNFHIKVSLKKKEYQILASIPDVEKVIKEIEMKKRR